MDTPESELAARPGVEGAEGAVVSITISLFVPSEPEAPGAGRVKTAFVPDTVLIVPPFNISAAVDR
ncbi:MAG: hypothetical protein VB106_04395 [Clostridiaceae bacterium]|nr:hypothetical protein [Clostridiaceae bacterium]